ncbi:hypothetical protein ACF0H5_012911 [Mactra antiquata]
MPRDDFCNKVLNENFPALNLKSNCQYKEVAVRREADDDCNHCLKNLYGILIVPSKMLPSHLLGDAQQCDMMFDNAKEKTTVLLPNKSGIGIMTDDNAIRQMTMQYDR